MQHKDLPQRWQQRIEEHLERTGRPSHKRLGVSDFSPSKQVNIRFEDGSFARFKYAFSMKAPEWREVAVFTDNCGYHIFNIHVEIEEEEM